MGPLRQRHRHPNGLNCTRSRRPIVYSWHGAELRLEQLTQSFKLLIVFFAVKLQSILVAMICSVCYDMLRGHQGVQWRGTFDLHFDHQSNRQQLKKSARMSCVICRSLLTELSRLEKKRQKGFIERFWNNLNALFRSTAQKQLGPERTTFTSAYLSEIYWKDEPGFGMYRLDFKVQDKEPVGTFVLQRVDLKEDTEGGGGSTSHHSGKQATYSGLQYSFKVVEDPSTSSLHTPFSTTTKSDEVLSLARDWIKTCSLQHEGCPKKDDYDYWYPSRLIDLGDANDPKIKRIKSDVVRLVSTEGFLTDGRRKNAFYMTLSHCWGKAKFTTLNDDNINQLLRDDIKISSLPQTFQDAIYFARRLSKQVRYLWIDSLCIIQGNRSDWLKVCFVLYGSSPMLHIFHAWFSNADFLTPGISSNVQHLSELVLQSLSNSSSRQ
jgi:hypothetical protein